MVCEVCGKEIVRTIKVIIEGTQIDACPSCSRFGKKVNTAPIRPKTSWRPNKSPMYRRVKTSKDIVDDYHQRIRKKREEIGLTQEELGKKINEKASIINRLEATHMPPNEKLAKKIERTLGIQLFEDSHDEKVEDSYSFSDKFTLGDMIKKKKV